MGTRYLFGKWEEANSPLTVEEVTAICKEADKHRQKVADYPVDKLMGILERMKALWSDPSYPLRKELALTLPEETGFSQEMIDLGLKELAWTLDPKCLSQKLKTELRAIPREGDFYFNPDSKTSLSWRPLGTVLHVLSGNVFLVAAGSLVEGLITGNVNIFKMSSGEKVFLPKLIESLIESDNDGIISKSIAAIDYSSSQTQVISEFKKRVDGIVVWGGEEAVKAYRNDLPARTRIILFGPKLSFGIVTDAGLREQKPSTVAEKLAGEISIWDQNACTAPQVCYVEGIENANALAQALTHSLDTLTQSLPPGKMDSGTAIEIQKMRGVFEIAEARKDATLLTSKKGLDWTVVVDKDKTLAPSPLHRTLRVVPFGKMAEVLGSIAGLRGYIQTVGIAASKTQYPELTRAFSQEGALRIVELGQMAGGEIDDPHDGSYDLPQLMNLVFSRTPSAELRPTDTLRPMDRQWLIDGHLRNLFGVARMSEFYKKRLEGISVQTTDDLVKVPILTRDEMERNMPPKGNGLSTGAYSGGYVSRSGGSTGEPKFSIYDAQDWEAMISNAARIFEALGLQRGDRVANCMLAGDLYGSFVSFDHINSRIGATSFAFAGQLNPEVFLDIWKKFQINVIEAMPTVLMPLLRVAKQLEPTFTIEKILYAGTPLSRSDAEWIRTVLKPERLASVIGANDGGQIAFQCEKMSGAMHHTIDDFNFIEIVDEKGNRVADGTPGRILITSLLKQAFPLIRYELGDQGRIIPEACACGRTDRVLEYMGRSDDMVCIGSMNVRYRDFAQALEKFPISVLQMAARNNERGEYILLRIETESNHEDFKPRAYETILERVAKMRERIEDGSIRVEIEICPPGLLPRNPRSGKVRTLVDERY